LFLIGADQADGVYAHADRGQPVRDDTAHIFFLMWLALLEGGRREEAGDMAGAWPHYRAVLRMARLLSRRANVFERFSSNADLSGLRNRLRSWAADPKTTVPQLRAALDEVMAQGKAFDVDSFALKREYEEFMVLLEDPNSYLEHGQGDDLTYRFGDMQLPPDLSARVYAARRFWMREPERSRRVLRLVFANWLAQSEVSREQRPKPAAKSLVQVLVDKLALPFYHVGPEAPAGARSVAEANRRMACDHPRRPAPPGIAAAGSCSP
jgi:hypothetical protein